MGAGCEPHVARCPVRSAVSCFVLSEATIQLAVKSSGSCELQPDRAHMQFQICRVTPNVFSFRFPQAKCNNVVFFLKA